MSNERKPQQPEDEARMEKQYMDKPQEEFVGDEAQPSKDMSEVSEATRMRAKEAVSEGQ